jgi:carbon-monoxide dehydrogenase medium subunit
MVGSEYFAPDTLQEAISLYQENTGAVLVAGGTDVLVNVAHGKSALETIIDLKRIRELDYIATDGARVRIGALATIAAVAESDIISERYPFVKTAATKLGSWQIRNTATVGGNICNAAPSAELATPLLAAGAAVTIAGPAGEKTVPLSDFFLGPGRTALETGAILKEIIVPPLEPGWRGIYCRHQLRRSMDISIVNLTALLQIRNETVLGARIYLGAVAPVPMRAVETEKKLVGNVLSREAIELAAETAGMEARPITDVRASADYRRQMVRVYMKRALTALQGREVSPR